MRARGNGDVTGTLREAVSRRSLRAEPRRVSRGQSRLRRSAMQTQGPKRRRHRRRSGRPSVFGEVDGRVLEILPTRDELTVSRNEVQPVLLKPGLRVISMMQRLKGLQKRPSGNDLQQNVKRANGTSVPLSSIPPGKRSTPPPIYPHHRKGAHFGVFTTSLGHVHQQPRSLDFAGAGSELRRPPRSRQRCRISAPFGGCTELACCPSYGLRISEFLMMSFELMTGTDRRFLPG